MNNTDFSSYPLSKKEKLLGTVWLAFEALLFSSVLQYLNRLLPTPLPGAEINFVFFTVNFTVVAFILRNFLSDQLQLIPQKTGRIAAAAAIGFVAYWMLNFLVSGLILALDPGFSSVNDNTVSRLTAENYGLMFFGTVFLVPITEESLFRGVVFRGLYDRSPVLAWVLSAAAFALLHILGYIGAYPPVQLLLCLLQYIPAGICLAAAYRLSGSILTPILIHAAVNFVGMMAMR